jgi:carbonic anhydrase/acetyltransferase-like protein (isoleucine patch superfamily)
MGPTPNIHDCAVVHVSTGHPTSIGEGVTIGHGAIVHGCTVGANTLIGMGAIILDDAEIGRDCIIGAGALVTRGTCIPDGSMAFGNPARVIRSLTDEEIEANRANAAEYVRLAQSIEEVIADAEQHS